MLPDRLCFWSASLVLQRECQTRLHSFLSSWLFTVVFGLVSPLHFQRMHSWVGSNLHLCLLKQPGFAQKFRYLTYLCIYKLDQILHVKPNLQCINTRRRDQERDWSAVFSCFYWAALSHDSAALPEPVQTVSGRSWTLDRLMRSWISISSYFLSLCPSLEPFNDNYLKK